MPSSRDPRRPPQADASGLARWLPCIWDLSQQPASCELSVVFVDDPMIRDLNRRFRGVDRATDVLAFPLEEPTEKLHPERKQFPPLAKGGQGGFKQKDQNPSLKNPPSSPFFKGGDGIVDVRTTVAGVSHNLLGDIVISLDTARRQARRYRTTVSKEIRRLAVHGLLHLVGYDHKKKKEARLMRAMERKLERLW